MTERRYHYLASLAGKHLLDHRPVPYLLGRPYDGEEEKAVYIVVNHDDLACYGGQTRPTKCWTGATGVRLGQHLREESKRREWKAFWVIPLKWATGPDIVNWYEDTVTARLGLPLRRSRGGRASLRS
jgi:hypothetical protein